MLIENERLLPFDFLCLISQAKLALNTIHERSGTVYEGLVKDKRGTQDPPLLGHSQSSFGLPELQCYKTRRFKSIIAWLP